MSTNAPLPSEEPTPRPVTRSDVAAAFSIVAAVVLAAWCVQLAMGLAAAPDPASRVGTAAAALLALGLAGLGLVRRREVLARMARVEFAGAVLAAIAAVAIAASLVLQQPDLASRGLTGEQAYLAFREAEAAFVVSMLGRGRLPEDPAGALSPEVEPYARFFGPASAKEAAKRARFGKVEALRQAATQDLAERYDGLFRGLYGFCRITGLEDAYHSLWFGALVALLVASLALGTKRQLEARSRIGFAVTHVGFILLLLGFAVSSRTARRGMVPLTVGETSAGAYARNSETPFKLPFRITLEDFSTKYRQRLLAGFDLRGEAGAGGRQAVEDYIADRPGAVSLLEGGKYRVEVLERVARATARARVVERAGSAVRPAVRLDFKAREAAPISSWLLADPAGQKVFFQPDSNLVVTFQGTDPFVERALEPDSWGFVRLAMPGIEPAVEPVRPGAELAYGGLRIRIKSVVRDFAARQRPLAEQGLGNPAIEVGILGPGETEEARRWAFAWVDFDALHAPAHPELRMSYLFVDQGLPKDRMIWLRSGEAGLEIARYGAQGNLVVDRGEVGKVLVSAPGEVELAVQEILRHAVVENEIQALPDHEAPVAALDEPAPGPGTPDGHESHGGHDHSGHDHAGHDHSGHDHGSGHVHDGARPAIRLRITAGGSTEEAWLVADDPDLGMWSDGRLALVYGSDTDKVVEWKSTLLVSDGTESRRQAIRVNEPMEFQGWYIFQSDAKAEDPTYSGLQVVNDPGWPLVGLGLLATGLGIIWIFWIEPLRRRPARSGEGAEVRHDV